MIKKKNHKKIKRLGNTSNSGVYYHDYSDNLNAQALLVESCQEYHKIMMYNTLKFFC